MSEKLHRSGLGDPLEYRPEQNEHKPGVHVGPEDKDREHENVSLEEGRNEGPGIRQNDTGLGQPEFEPSAEEKHNITNVSREDLDRLRQDQDDIQRQFEEKLLELEKTGFRIPGAIYRTVLWTMIFIGGILGLFMVNQGVRFAGQVTSLPLPWNIVAALAFLFFLGIIFVVIVRIAWKFMAFKKLTRVDIKALNFLAQRKKFQKLAARKKDEARKIMVDYLQDFNLDDPKMAVPGLEKVELKKLGSFKQSLVDKKGFMDSAQWLKEFDESFVHVLDKAARKRIRSYTRTVALGTAASPIKFIDQMIVLYASLKLIGELLVIYNLRPAFGQSAAILSRAIIQAYLSGVIGEQSEAGAEAFSEYYESIFGEISFATGVSAVTDATRFILPKVSEGALNGFLIWRLGRQAQRMLRPL